MDRRTFVTRLATAVFATGAVTTHATAEKLNARTRQTRILVKDMHCSACAKKIARKLFTVPGVRHVKAVVKTNAAVITPEQQKVLSPLALWEAVESAGFEPVKLEGPSGSFSKKPAS